MPWPLSQDYNEALQTPATCFSDPELKGTAPVCNALGLPVPCSGNFADVYALASPSGRKWAAKCFTREVPGLCQRYRHISEALRAAALPFMVDCQMLEQGVRVRGQWYPLLKMHWVEGFTLNDFVRQRLDKPTVLDTLAQIWVRLMARLEQAGIAHGDLQHGNIMLVPGVKANALSVRLVDYDGMFVPDLAARPPSETGHPNYQHADRQRQGTYSRGIDRFPGLVIYTALRALVARGQPLFEQFDNGENLLFTRADFEDPDRSPVFEELRRINPQVEYLANQLAGAARQPLERTPPFEELATQAAALSSKHYAAARPQPAPSMRTVPDVAVVASQESHPQIAVEEGTDQEVEEVEEVAGTSRGKKKKRRRKKRSKTPSLATKLLVGAVLMVLAAVLIPRLVPTRTPADAAEDTQSVNQSNLTGANEKAKEKNGSLLSLSERNVLRNPFGHNHSRAVSTDGKLLADLIADGGFQLATFDVASGNKLNSTKMPTPGMVVAVEMGSGHRAFINHGGNSNQTLLDSRIMVLEAQQGKLLKTFDHFRQPFFRLRLTSDGQFLIVTSKHGSQRLSIVVLESETGREIRRLDEDHVFDPHFHDLRLSATGQRVVVTGVRGARDQPDALIWDLQTGASQLVEVGPEPAQSACFIDDDRLITAGAINQTSAGAVRCWDLRTRRQLWEHAGRSFQTVAISTDKSRVLVGCGSAANKADSGVVVLDAATGQPTFRFTKHTSPVGWVRPLPNGSAISADWSGAIWQWRIEN